MDLRFIRDDVRKSYAGLKIIALELIEVVGARAREDFSNGGI